LITASWADSRLSQSELNYIKELARHFDLSDDDWFELQPYIEDPVSKEEREAILRDLLARISTSSERNAIIGHIERIISADDTISEDEKELLRKYEDILREPSSLDLMMGGVKALFGKPETRSTLDEFLRNKILFKLRRTIGSDQITPDMHRTALLGGLMGIVAHADHDIHEQELEEIRVQLSREGNFDDDTMDLLLNIVEEESVRGLDRYRLITEYTKDVTPEGRVELLDLLFGVAAADGEVGHHELEELRSMSSSLGLSHKQYIAAKIRQKPGS